MEGWCNADIPERIVVSYEDLSTDCVGTMAKITKFLGLDVNIETLERIVEANSFEKMKKRDLSFVPGSKTFKGKGIMKDPDLQFLREGKVGGWADHLTVTDSKKMEGYIKTNKTTVAMFVNNA